jgi:hypothetical protein
MIEKGISSAKCNAEISFYLQKKKIQAVNKLHCISSVGFVTS